MKIHSTVETFNLAIWLPRQSLVVQLFIFQVLKTSSFQIVFSNGLMVTVCVLVWHFDRITNTVPVCAKCMWFIDYIDTFSHLLLIIDIGVMISGYSRNTTIRDNEFHLIGENGIVSWGYTADFPNAQRKIPIPETQGLRTYCVDIHIHTKHWSWYTYTIMTWIKAHIHHICFDLHISCLKRIHSVDSIINLVFKFINECIRSRCSWWKSSTRQ